LELYTLPKRKPLSHKGDYGRLLIIGGSIGYTGAPTLAAKAALRSGAGLVSIGVPEEIYQITAVKNDEAMPFPLPSRDGMLSSDAIPEILRRAALSDVIAFGMGAGRRGDIMEILTSLLEKTDKPLLIDADGLNALADLRKNPLSPVLSERVVLTPHEGEFARLGGIPDGDAPPLTHRRRVGLAATFTEKHKCALVLKGHRAICAFPDGNAHIINAGNPGMAKGGSGDVLSGVIAAMLCQLEFRKAVVMGTLLHALAGDIAAKKFGEYSMTPTDLTDCLRGACRLLRE